MAENEEKDLTSEETPKEIPEETAADEIGAEGEEAAETASSSGDAPESGVDPSTLKEGFGRDEYAKTVGNADYYKKQGEELRKRQEQAQLERANRYKNRGNEDEGGSPVSNDNTPQESNLEKKEEPSSKELTKEERDESKKSATPSSEGEKKNLVDKAKDAKNVASSKAALAKNKIDSAKAKAYAARHPVEAAKAEAKEKLKKKALLVVKQYWWVFAIAALVFLILMIIFLVALGAAGDESGDGKGEGFLDPKYDYTGTNVILTKADGTVLDSKIQLRDVVLGSVYYATINHTNEFSDDQMYQMFAAYSVLFKTEALALGGYSNETMEIKLISGDGGLPYCDPFNGCIVTEENGKRIFYSLADENAKGKTGTKINPMEPEKLEILYDAYESTVYEILTPSNVKKAITEYNYGNPPYDSEHREKLNAALKENTPYQKALEDTYSKYKLYDIRDYATYYQYTNNTAYWWPIGSSSETSEGIYGGTPTSTSVTSEFTGNRCIQGVCKAHKGVDLGGHYGTSVIIATRGGTVTTANDGCASTGYYGCDCGGGYGNWVMIDHGDGTSSVYAHMYQGSITVKVGDHVAQGQKIGLMGSSGSSTGAHLHFEIRINGSQVDPLKYISASNPRPVASTIGEGTIVNGSENVQTVCLSLKASGFSNEAVAGILANIQYESGFRTSGTGGDGGTSDGLCQWHLGRLDRLKSMYGDQWDQVGSQVQYLIWELKNSEKGAYNALLNGGSAYDLGAAFCVKFERPANTQNCYDKRGTAAQNTYYPYVMNNCSN